MIVPLDPWTHHTYLFYPLTLHTSKETTFDPLRNLALVPIFFASGTRETFSPGWKLQPGLKVPAQRLMRQAFAAEDL